MIVPVILSGGSGSRLWPLSRKQFPKQFLALTGEKSMFQQTLLRLARLGTAAPIVVCNEEHRFLVSEQLAGVRQLADSILLEPFGRNTAAAVAMAALRLLREGRDELLLVLPADHLLEEGDVLDRAVAAAKRAAENGHMALFGIKPTRPETGYGYIRAAARDAGLPQNVLPVQQFIEKPELARAQSFVDSGDYYWNSGMFLFRASQFLSELQTHEPDIYDTCQLALEKSCEDLAFVRIDAETFACCPENSIDYALMERTEKACVVPLDSQWNDIGSWQSLWESSDKDGNGNALRGDALVRDSHNCLVHSSGKLVTVLGMQDTVVVETRDALLVAPRERSQEVKQLVDQLNQLERTETKQHCHVSRPWGIYESVHVGERFQVKHITVNPGASLSLQMHHHRAEHWIVVSGTAQVTRDEKTFLLTENQSTFIPMTAVHRLSNPGKIPLQLIEVQSGGYLGEDDIERLEDVYGRVALNED